VRYTDARIFYLYDGEQKSIECKPSDVDRQIRRLKQDKFVRIIEVILMDLVSEGYPCLVTNY
jgi:hypothetical protein